MKQTKNIVIWVYLTVMLGYFPLFYRKRYAGMGDGKYHVFLYASIICFLILLVLSAIQLCKHASNVFSIEKSSLSMLDMAVITYFIVVGISFLFSDFKQEALLGASGWNMGIATQLALFFSYWFISRDFQWNKKIVYVMLISTSLVYIIGILHRFNIDPLSMYTGLDIRYRQQFLSTIGQSSWYSSFVCTVFPIGLYILYIAKEKKTVIWSSIYSVLGFATIVTQNTDSAFLALGGVLILLYYFSYDSAKKRKRFWQIVIMMFATFKLMGILQILFKDKMVPIETFSIQVSQGMITTILFLVVLLYYFLRYRIITRDIKWIMNRKVFYILMGIVLLGFIGVLTFIVLNSNGYLLEKFGYRNTNNYLLFNDGWGNNRGFSWRFSIFSFKNNTWIQKLIGVGPDCFKAYHESIPEYKEVISTYFWGLSLTNAHNAYLTTLINYGVLGVISYLYMLVTGVITLAKSRKKQPMTAAFALSAVAYMIHNIFCYQEVCCTPFIAIFIGLGMNLLRNGNETSFE